MFDAADLAPLLARPASRIGTLHPELRSRSG
jgi:hypothetical protein